MAIPRGLSIRSPRRLALLCLATLGVVYGDIGTSPLYTVSQIFFGPSAIARTPENAVGATSLILWILTLSVTLKYILLVLRANHEGQGGTFALLGLLQRRCRARAASEVGRCSAGSASPWCWRRACSSARASSRQPSRCSPPSRA